MCWARLGPDYDPLFDFMTERAKPRPVVSKSEEAGLGGGQSSEKSMIHDMNQILGRSWPTGWARPTPGRPTNVGPRHAFICGVVHATLQGVCPVP